MRSLIPLLLLTQLLAGCWVSHNPKPLEQIGFMDQAVTVEHEGITVTASVPSREQARAITGVPVDKHGVQPVWLSIENGSERTFILNPTQLDPLYYTASEAAYVSRFKASRRLPRLGLFTVLFIPLLIPGWLEAPSAAIANRQMGDHFQKIKLDTPVLEPGEKAEGFYFARSSEGTKPVSVHLFGPEGEETIDLFPVVPGAELDYQRAQEDPYEGQEIPDYTDYSEFKAALEALPCCVTNAKGTVDSDPLNLVIIGTGDDLLYALKRAGWDETEALNTSSAWKSFTAFFSGRDYRTSPMSSLFLYGRGQDAGFQLIRNSIHDRHHFRLWLAPFTWEGTPVWLGAVTRDIGVKLTTKSWYLTTHEIDAEVDDARDYVALTLLNTYRVAAVAEVGGVGEASKEEPRENHLGSKYFTDGRRLVVQISHLPTTEIVFVTEQGTVAGTDEPITPEP